MNDLNYVVLEGKLTHDPKLSMITADSAVCTFPIAVNKSYLDRTSKTYKQDTSYFFIETWHSVARACDRYLCKGRGIRVVGHLKQVRWSDGKEDPKERVYIVAEHIEFQPKKDKPDAAPQIIRPEDNAENGIDTEDARTQLDESAKLDAQHTIPQS